MRRSLTKKLFAAFAAVTIVVILLMLLFVNWSFNRGFNGYLMGQEQRHLELLSERALNFYSEEGSWTRLQQDHRAWRELLSLGGAIPLRLPPKGEGDKEMGLHPPPPNSSHDKPPPLRGPTPIEHRISLLDAQGHFVVGNPRLGDSLTVQGRDLFRIPLLSQGEIVGFLLSREPEFLDDVLVKSFQAHQLRHLLWVAPVALLLALLIAGLLVKQILKPIKLLAAGTKTLTAGDYSHRIELMQVDEMGRLAEDFNTLAQTLENEENLRQRWIADTSHELRTPLAVLRSEIEAIQDGIRKPEPHRIAALHSQVLSLSKLVNDLHQLSLGDAGLDRQDDRELDLVALLQSVFVSNESMAQSQQLALDFAAPSHEVMVRGDQTRLLQLFNNLIANSLYHTEAGGQVKVELQQLQDRASVRIFDSKPGVSDEALPQLFDRLYRPDSSRNRNSGGAGLGLAIAQQISAAHGATLEAGHSPLGGVLLTFTIPLSSSQQGLVNNV